MALINYVISSNKYSLKSPYIMKPIGIVIHNTSNNASARNEADYMKSNNKEVGFHIVIDDKEALLCIPLNRNTWHCGDGGSGKGNRNYIGVEIAYSADYKSDKFSKAESRAVEEVAQLCKKYGFTVDNIKPHKYFSATNCPHRTNINSFKDKVKKRLEQLNKPVSKTKYYRVWVDGKKIGAYTNSDNAMKVINDNKNKEIKMTYGE